MKKFGGGWTEKKIEILVEYAQAYLVIMNRYPYWELIYFDGFAGSGMIRERFEGQEKIIHGSARRILEIDKPRSFDLYYFVEKNDRAYAELIRNTKNEFPNKEIILVKEDCNKKLKDLANFLNSHKGKKSKVLAYIDPFGMQLNWDSIECLSDLSIDLFVLVPTGLGVNRLLKKDGKMRESWYLKLEKFLGLTRQEIDSHFYERKSELTLFGEETYFEKESKAIEKAGLLYGTRLRDVFAFVSKPFLLRNRQNSIMFHFFMASNNRIAIKIANNIINKFSI